MEDRGFLNINLLFLVVLLGILFGVPFLVSAYNDKTTHPLLTGAVVDLYNSSFSSSKLSTADKSLVVQGSIDEDAFGRWMHHFYDPIYNTGLTSWGGWASSKIWAQNHQMQAQLDPKMIFLAAVVKPFDGSTDYSWERSIYEYAWGDKTRGLNGLGHILHLLEDKAVPDHTRDDDHPTGSVYESWATGAKMGETGKMGPVILSSVGDYFDNMASYSNDNFFSSDTIFKSKYTNPDINFYKMEKLSNGRDVVFGYADINGDFYKVVRSEAYFSWYDDLHNKDLNKYFITDDDNLILSDYWSRLSQQVVANGAGVVKLFFDEVAKEKQSKKLLAYNKSPISNLTAGILSVFYSPTLKQAQTDPELRADLDLPPISTNSADSDKTQAAVINLVSSAPPAPSPQTNQAPPIAQNNNGAADPLLPQITAPVFPPGIPIIGAAGPPPPPAQSSSSNSQNSSDGSSGSNSNDNSGGSNDSGTGGGSDSGGSGGSDSGGGNDNNNNPPADTDPPNLSYSISSCNTASLSNNGCLLLVGTNLVIAWSSTSTDLSSYTVECTKSGSNCADFPLTDTSATSTTANLSEQGSYTFTFKAKDTAGNSTTTAKQLEINPRPLVINEVAWMGTVADETDEWIELFNVSNFDVYLGDGGASSWTLTATDNDPAVHLNGTIAANGFFVLERTNSNTTSYSENQIFTGALNDVVPGGGDNLILKTAAGDTIDATTLVNNNTGEVAGTKLPQRKTAERINPFYYSATAFENAFNWRTSTSAGSTVTDKNGAPILGTPGLQNSAYNTNWRPTYILDHTAAITADTTWSPNGSPYIMESSLNQRLTVNSGATLTIEPGTVIMAQGLYYPILTIDGTLKAEGTSAQNIIFTTLKDSDYGGTGGAEKGSWARIVFGAASSGNSIKYAKFRYGGYYQSDFDSDRPVIAFTDSTEAIVDSCVIEESFQNALIFSTSGFTGVTIKNTEFKNNALAPIRIVNGAPNILNNTATGSLYNGIFVFRTATFNSDLSWQSTLPYILDSTNGMIPTVSAGATLTVNPGVVLKPMGSGEALHIDGVMNWPATAENPGIITSFKDDTYGGDTNNDGTASSPQIGDWPALKFTNTTATSTLSNIKARYGAAGSEFILSAGALLEKNNVVTEP